MSSIIEMYKLDIADLENLISQSKRSNIQRQLTEYKNNLQKLLNDEEKKLTASKEQTTDEKKNEPVKEEFKLPFTAISNYALDTSNENFIKLYVTSGFSEIKSLPSSNIKSKFTKNTFDVCVLNFKGKNYRFNCFNLNKEIIPEDSYVKQTNSGLIVYLKKQNKSDMWDSLEKKKNLFGSGDDENKFKNKDPNESLMDMMRDMYQNGDPEMKKMIAEAWTKSREETEKKGK
jgi:calcyclin binding protein